VSPHLKGPRLDADRGKPGRLQDAAQILAVAERVRPRRMRRQRRRRAEMAHRDLKRDLPVRVLLDRRPHRHDEPPARPQCPDQVAERGDRIGEEHDPEPRGQEIIRTWIEGMHLRVGEEQLDIGQPVLGDAPARRVEHRARDIGRGDMPRRADRLGIGDRRDPGAAADIEDALAGPGRGRLQKLRAHFDMARLLHGLPPDPARPRDLVPVPLHRRIAACAGSFRSRHGNAFRSCTLGRPRPRRPSDRPGE
jgi:hypothetical protein